MTATNQVGFEIQVLWGKMGWLNAVPDEDKTGVVIFTTKAEASTYYDDMEKHVGMDYRIYPSLKLPIPKTPCTTPCFKVESASCKFCLFNTGTMTK